MIFHRPAAALVLFALLLAVSAADVAAQARQITLVATDGVDSIPVILGLDPSATDGIDAGLGEQELPPFPPSGVFEARLIDADIPSTGLGEGSYRDIRAGDATTATVTTHEIRFQRGSGAAVTLTHDLPAGVSIAVADLFGGVIVSTVLSGAGQYTVPNPIIDKLKLTVTWPQIVAANGVPVAVADGFTTNEDTPLVVNADPGVLGNDTDPDFDILTAVLESGVSHGTLALNANGSFTYTPAADYFGPDQFSYRAHDGTDSSAPAVVSLTVSPVNDVPVAQNGLLTTNKNTAGVVTLSASDVDGDALTFAVATPPAHGTVSIAGNQATYTPSAGYSGADSFTFTASDGSASSNPATVSVTVVATNAAPVAVTDAYATNEDTALVIASTSGVLANDSDPDQDALTAVLVSSVSHGTLTLNANGSFTYAPAANFFGADSFSYRANDGTLSSAPVTVSLTVTAVNDAPVAQNGLLTTNKNTAGVVTLSASDVDGDALTFAVATPPAHGTVSIAGNQATYTPSADYVGADSFTFTASDGSSSSNEATVTISVAEVLAPPTGAPLILGPSNGSQLAAGTSWNFSWTAVPGATRYDMEQNGVITDAGSATLLAVSFVSAQIGVRSWRVRGANAAGAGPWSVTRTFTVVSGTDTEASIEELPTEVRLHRNYPNPFNPRTNIRFEVPERAHVRLAAYDMMGNLVRLLVDRDMEAGSHETRFDGSDLTSGTYVVRLETGSSSLSRLMTLVK